MALKFTVHVVQSKSGVISIKYSRDITSPPTVRSLPVTTAIIYTVASFKKPTPTVAIILCSRGIINFVVEFENL